ncbi:MAG: hypothetical protein E7613_02850 [Ruminococcaceae bacterium]|nr:hypothetical protein [Oscillospiraceae bacterium]
MKKIIVVLLMMMLSITALAQEQFENAGELFQYWEGNDAYPDYVCGMWSTDGGYFNLTISVQNTEEGNRGKEEILALVEDDNSITFVYGENSYNYLKFVQNELIPYFGKESGLIMSGIDVMTSRINVGFLEEKMYAPETVALMEELRGKYGDVFTVETSGLVYTYTEDIPPVSVDFIEKSAKDYTAFAVIGGLLLLLGAAAVFRKKVMVANTGETLTRGTPSKKEVEEAVKNTKIDYPSNLDTKIKEKIDGDN